MRGFAAAEKGRGVALARLAVWAGVLALAALLLLTLLLLAHRYRLCHDAFTSDALFAVALCREILGRGYETVGWHIPYAPQVFPDLLLLLPCVVVCKDLLWTFLAYFCLYYGATLGVLTALFRLAGLRGREALRLACAGPLLLVATLLQPACVHWLPIVFVPACHTGAVLIGLGLWLLLIRTLHRPIGWKAAGTFVVLGGLALFADRLVLPQFLGPICLVTATLAAVRVVPVRKVAETTILCGAAYGLAAVLFFACRWYGFIVSPLTLPDLTQIPAALTKLTADLPVYVRGQYAVVATFFALLALAPVAGVCQALKARRGRLGGAPADAPAPRQQAAAAAIALAAVFACLSNLGGLVLSGVGRLEGTDRYLLAALFLPFLFLALCLRLLPGRWGRRLTRAFPLVVALYAAYEMFLRPGTPPFALRELCQPYPELAQTLDRLARAGKIHRGIATYWNGRKVQYLTRENVPLKVVWPHGEPWLHLQNPYTWLAPARSCLEAPRYDFLIFDAREPMFPMRREEILGRFGSPREIVPSGHFQIWLYDGLIGNQVTLALRSFLAGRCRAQLGFTGPTQPRALATPVRNFASMRASRRVEVGPDGAVRLTFAGPVRGGLIDLGAPFDGHYEVTFHNGGEDLGTVYVPRVNVPNLSSGWPNNQSRLVTVPLAARQRGWTAVTVRGAGGPGAFALSHFLVYDEPGRPLTARQMSPGGRWRFESEFQPSPVQDPDAVVEDPHAGEGKARFAPRDFSGLVVRGPYLPLEPGRYRVEFHVKAGPGEAAGPLGHVEVTSQCGKRVHALRPLVSSDFDGREGYQVIQLDLETDVDLWDCEFRVFSVGQADLYVDRVELVCER